MGEILGIPEWLAFTLVLLGFCSILFAIASRNTTKMVRRTLARRENPTRDEFMEMMAEDVSPEAAEFLWETCLFYLKPRLTPHPDDDLVRDLPIDDGDWSMDWPRDFAERQGFHESNLPCWPDGWSATIRNYGKWLSLGAGV